MKAIFIPLFLLITITSNSQNYIPFPTQNAQWNCTYATGWYNTPNDNGTETDDESYLTAGDTVINSILYTKVERFGTHTTFWVNPNFGTYWNNYVTSTGYYGCYRNDTNNRMVLFIPRDSTNEEVLYDFNVSVGDTINHWWRGKQEIYFGDNTINGIDSVLINGNWHKRLLLTSNYLNYPVIEGIGSESGIFNPFNYFESDGRLICFKVNGQQIYPDWPEDCDLINSTPKIPVENNIKVYPNPSTGMFYFENIDKGSSINILNNCGQIVLQSLSFSGDFQIDLSENEKGIYYCKVVTPGGKIFMQKLSIN